MTRIPKYNSLLFCFVKEAGKSTYTLYKKDCMEILVSFGRFSFSALRLCIFLLNFTGKSSVASVSASSAQLRLKACGV